MGVNFWFIYVICALVIAFFIYTKHNKTTEVMFVIYSFLMWFVGSFRYGIGNDFFTYKSLYENLMNPNYPSQYLEPAFRCYVFVLNYISVDVQVLFVLYITLTLFFVYRGAKYYFPDKRYYILFLLLYFLAFNGGYTVSFNIMRQSLAMAIIFYSTRYVLERNISKFIVFVFFAFINHYSAILFMFLYFLPKFKIGLRKSFVCIMIFMLVFLSPLGSVVIDSFITGPFLNGLGYGGYVSKIQMANVEEDMGVNFATVFLTLLYLFGAMVNDKYDKSEILVCNASFIYILMRIVADVRMDNHMVHMLFQRISIYLSLLYFVFIVRSIPKVAYVLNVKKMEYAISLIIVLLFSSALLLAIYTNEFYNPYKMFDF